MAQNDDDPCTIGQRPCSMVLGVAGTDSSLQGVFPLRVGQLTRGPA